MTFTAIMFARHTQGEDTGANRVSRRVNACVIDLGGSEAMPFLTQELGLDIARLTAKGMGLRGEFDGGVLCVYYFAENAFRLVLENAEAASLISRLNQGAEQFDISVMERCDLVVSRIQGESAFESLVTSFKLTPGLRISDDALCYCAQSQNAFITVQSDNKHAVYQLVAKHEDEEKWQHQLHMAGFAVSEQQVA